MKTNNLLPRLLWALLLCATVRGVQAQDIHFSQLSNSPVNLNSGLAGVFGGDTRVVLNYRDQWRVIPAPYSTFSGSVEQKFYFNQNAYNKFITLGLLLNYDKQGSLALKTLRFGIPIGVTLPTIKNQYLTLGIMPSFGQRAFSTDKLTVDSQWNNYVFDPLADTREGQLFEQTSLKYFDLNIGLNYRFQSKSKRNRLDVGFGMQHVNRPNQDFWSSSLTSPGNVRLYAKQSYYALGLVQLTDNFDFVGQGIFQRQGSYREIIYGGGVRFHLNRNVYNELALQIGANYRQRFRDALIPYVEVHWRTWVLGVSYDANFFHKDGKDSNININIVTDKRAGPEVSLSYRFYKIKPVGPFKSCPII